MCVGRSCTPPKTGAYGERWPCFFTPLSVLLAHRLPSQASAELGGGRAQLCLCMQESSHSDGPNPSRNGAVEQPVLPVHTGLSGYLYGSLFHAQVLPLSCLGSTDSPMEHTDVLMVHGTAREAGRGLVQRGLAAGTTPCWAGTGQPKALGACCL